MFFKNKNLFFVILSIVVISLLFIGNYFPVFEGYTKDRAVKSNNCSEMHKLYGSNGIALYGYADHSGNPFNEHGYEVLGCNPDGSLKLGGRAVEAINTTPPKNLPPLGNTAVLPSNNPTPSSIPSTQEATQTSSNTVQSFPF